MALAEFEKDMNIISKLDDEPNDVGGLSSAELKAKFDEGGLALKAWLNEALIPSLIAANLGFAATEEINAETIQDAVEASYAMLTQALERAKTDLTDSIDGVRDDLQGAVMGSIPPTSVTYEKLASDVTDLIDGLQTGLGEAEEKIKELDARQVVIDPATQSKDGLLTAEDKKKLDGIAEQATRVLVDNALSETSTNAIQNKAVREALTALQTSITQALTQGLAEKANSRHTHVLTDVTDYKLDEKPAENSGNPVKSGGVYTALKELESGTDEKINSFIDSWAVIPMQNLGGLMAAVAHQGGGIAYASNITADAFLNTDQIESKTGVCLGENGAYMVAEGLTGGYVVTSTGSSSYTPTFPASNTVRQVGTKQAWTQIFTFTPAAFGTLTNLTLLTSNTSTSSTKAQVKLGLFDANTDELLLETDVKTISRSDSVDVAVSFATDYLLEAGRAYAMKLWFEVLPVNYGIVTYTKLDITAVTYSSGSITAKEVTLPTGAKKAVILLHCGNDYSSVFLSIDGGDHTAATLDSSTSDRVPGGTACLLKMYHMDIPEGSETLQLKLTLDAVTAVTYDYAMILL